MASTLICDETSVLGQKIAKKHIPTQMMVKFMVIFILLMEENPAPPGMYKTL